MSRFAPSHSVLFIADFKNQKQGIMATGSQSAYFLCISKLLPDNTTTRNNCSTNWQNYTRWSSVFAWFHFARPQKCKLYWKNFEMLHIIHISKRLRNWSEHSKPSWLKKCSLIPQEWRKRFAPAFAPISDILACPTRGKEMQIFNLLEKIGK